MSSDYQSFARVALSEAFNGLNIEPYEWLDNTLHSREWVENEQQGHGVETWADGSKFEGQYFKGQK